MASVLSLHVIKFPNDTQPAGVTSAGVIYGVPIPLIQNITAATAAQIAAQSSYAGTLSVIQAYYFRGAQRLTGTWYVTESVATITTAAAAAGTALQSIHALAIPAINSSNSTDTPGFAGAGNIYLIANNMIDSIQTTPANLVAKYPNALAQINTRFYNNSQQFTGYYLATETVAAVIAAS